MRPSERRKWKSSDEPSPREKRELIEKGEWSEEDDGEPGKAPFIFRLAAWASLVVIFFAVGYGATSLVFKWMDNRGGNRHPQNLVRNQDEAGGLLGQMGQDASAGSGDSAPKRDSSQVVTIFMPNGSAFMARQIVCPVGLREDTMKLALSAYMDAMKESQMLGPSAQALNVFQSGDWLYLNMNKDFLESIKSLGADKSRILLTGMVKTMSDNFAPVNKIKFYVDGEEVRDKKPLDLTMPWGITARSR
ncbi:MAG: GerMN domain-containing protein [Synergistaceae bacterium]|jgi:hypothetical protein|nr:GerMN domain-containing protein [Synergistaceae bacterium]